MKERITRREFTGTAAKAGVKALLALDAMMLIQSSSERGPRPTTETAPDYLAPIAKIPERAVRVGQEADGVARIDRTANPVVPADSERFREMVSVSQLMRHPDFDFSCVAEAQAPHSDVVAFEHPRVGDDGMLRPLSSAKAILVHASRFSPVFNAVERRYSLPRGLLTAMCMQESTGLDLLPNMQGDGGFGLIHMQNATAHEFGLHISGDPKKVIDHENGAELAQLIKKYGATGEGRAFLNEHDERLNPLANADAAGRMMAAWAASPTLISAMPHEKNPLVRALARFSGPKNRDAYVGKVATYLSMVNDLRYLEDVEQQFAEANYARRMSDGGLVTYRGWLREYEDYVRQTYPLDEYEQLPLVRTSASESLAQTYQDAMSGEMRRFLERSKAARV